MWFLWFVVGVVIGGLAAYANMALRFAQVHHALADSTATLTRMHGRWRLTIRTVTHESHATEKLLPFLFRVTITEAK